MATYITLNPKYTLKPNMDQALLLSTDSADFDNVFFIIHPIYAMILSCVNGRDIDIIIEDASSKLQVKSDLVRNFLFPLLENKSMVSFKFNGAVMQFPSMTILYSNVKPYRNFAMEEFNYESVDLNYKRLIIPAHFTLMVNNICKTNCYYCYADRRLPQQSSLPLKKIRELIKEAYENHVISINTIGGEFFLYPYWKELIIELHKYGYHVNVSTKIPLTHEQIEFLISNEISFLQISLDTMIKENLIRILRVKDDYYEKIIKSFELLNEAGITICVHTILNRYNDSLEDMKSLFEFLSRFSNIRYWRCDMVGKSLYNSTSIEEMLPDPVKQKEISSYMSQLKENAGFVIYPVSSPPPVKNISKQEKYDKFMNRGFCTGNFSAVFILPDGKVTICEELYWHPRFIIGDITKQSLEEVWNSEIAKRIYYVEQTLIPKDSYCSECKVFKKCRTFRQVCHKNILKEFGMDRWYYPDPDCPFVVKKNV